MKKLVLGIGLVILVVLVGMHRQTHINQDPCGSYIGVDKHGLAMTVFLRELQSFGYDPAQIDFSKVDEESIKAAYYRACGKDFE